MINFAEVNPGTQRVQRTQTFGGSDVFLGGFRYDPAGSLVCAIAGVPVSFVNGFGFTANGLLCIDTAGTIDAYRNGLPFSAAGQLLVTVAGPANYVHGWPVAGNGRVCFS